ncbi:Eco57I restriction-modification methylase domain-containing protein [Paracrocinitomix mangrovi]|uniref:Eco57I restriction-modification methylase domain-containing protein n=1 Tax=Paracrocinitomix mangrovi TaxID=2862509 RepID=UPI001C8EF083|nr:Eco57I restriction-modification methylase domain-containing protein [Paracrocinitomix mangrovi]UKN02236.1 Eco57I restriction-modification methylase domain-containing protein [Paracrocinitomix mangrovi]
MSPNKSTGSYYTPEILSDFLVSHIFRKYVNKNAISILEPSCGDGQFIASLFAKNAIHLNADIDIELIDINKSELEKANKLIPSGVKYNSVTQDYLERFINGQAKYSLIIGNPPYIKKSHLQEKQIDRCEEVHQMMKEYNSIVTSNAKIKNIWPAFIEANIMSLTDDGILCLVIPAEILQVKYAQELRALIADEFDRVEVFAFNELIFEGIQQDVIALIGVKGVIDTNEHGFSFYQVDSLEDLKEPKFTEKHSNIHRTTLDKWTNYILTDQELNFVDNLKNQYSSVKSFCQNAEVGIVTAANDYFILSEKDLNDNKLKSSKSLIKPILPKGYFVSNICEFSEEDYELLKLRNVKVNFIHFPDVPQNKFGKSAQSYLQKGEELELHLRYKMKKRNNWYHVPGVWLAEGLFIKRSHRFPKMFVNTANVFATDSFYRIVTKEEFDIKNLVFSFYNSLTFILAELEGRYYGGGVLELTPNEFKGLVVPYNRNITDDQFATLDRMLRSSTPIEQILTFTNAILFEEVDVKRLESIRTKLVNRRLKKLAQNGIFDSININELDQNSDFNKKKASEVL